MKVRALFFDLDGTLVDTHESNFLAYSESIKNICDRSHTGDLKSHIISGESSNEFLPKVVENISVEDIKRVNAEKKRVYAKHLDKSVRNDKLVEFMQDMVRLDNVIIALVTTAKRENALKVLERHSLTDKFHFMIFGEDVENTKPHPEAYLLALERAGISKGEALAFEDSEKGISAAVAAGIQTIHIRSFENE